MRQVLLPITLALVAFLVAHGEETCPGSKCVPPGHDCTDDAEICGTALEKETTVCCSFPHTCHRGKCTASSAGLPCKTHAECFGFANLACLANECVEVREVGDSCGGEGKDSQPCAPGTSCVAGVCKGSGIGTECLLPKMQTCEAGLLCLNGRCAAGLAAGANCSGDAECDPGLFCGPDNKCAPFWSTPLGGPCERSVDECEIGNTCHLFSEENQTCVDLSTVGDAWHPCTPSDANGTSDCLPGATCRCFRSGNFLCSYEGTSPYPRRQQEHKRALLECLLSSGCSLDILSHVLNVKKEWSCARRNCGDHLKRLARDYFDFRKDLDGACIDSTLYGQDRKKIGPWAIVAIVAGIVALIGATTLTVVLIARRFRRQVYYVPVETSVQKEEPEKDEGDDEDEGGGYEGVESGETQGYQVTQASGTLKSPADSEKEIPSMVDQDAPQRHPAMAPAVVPTAVLVAPAEPAVSAAPETAASAGPEAVSKV